MDMRQEQRAATRWQRLVNRLTAFAEAMERQPEDVLRARIARLESRLAVVERQVQRSDAA